MTVEKKSGCLASTFLTADFFVELEAKPSCDENLEEEFEIESFRHLT